MRRKTLTCERYRRHISFFKTLILLSAVLFSPAFASAQTEEEMKMLRMYFKEDELVIAPTRAPKPVSKVAENITVVTAEEIEAMNAHTVLEVLERVTGVFIDFFGHDFGSDGNLNIQDVDQVDNATRHVLVLVDGITWNFMSGGNAVTNSIPVRIIKRIEIIKGPASSSWGSSLGGVINIVTKDTGSNALPTGSVSASYGERNTQDYSAEASGKTGIVGYYLYAGKQKSDGLRDNRFFENDSFYGKIDVPFTSNVKLLLTAGYSDPNINYGDLPSYNLTAEGTSRAFYTTASLNVSITDELALETSFYKFNQKLNNENTFIEDEAFGNAGDSFKKFIFDEETTGGSGKLMWTNNTHNAVFGVDVSHGELDQSQQLLEDKVETTPGISKWAVYLNDTISIGSLSVTPGIRYDKNNINGDFTSPSLGATYKFSNRTILRASIARGFTSPPLSFISGGGLFLDANPDLNPEKVWSYQAGVESWIKELLKAKFVYFHHNLKDAQVETFASNGNSIFVNDDEIKRNGIEIEVETIPFNNISVKSGFTYIRKEYLLGEDILLDRDSVKDNYSSTITAKYNDMKSFSAQIDGRYFWWQKEADLEGKYNAFIWDLNLQKIILQKENLSGNVFFTIHNIFNGSYYTDAEKKNPGRWVEAGVRFKF